jgi:hypothetical protein
MKKVLRYNEKKMYWYLPVHLFVPLRYDNAQQAEEAAELKRQIGAHV